MKITPHYHYQYHPIHRHQPPQLPFPWPHKLLRLPLRRGAWPWSMSIRLGRPRFSRISPPRRCACAGCSPNFYRGSPLGRKVCGGGGGGSSWSHPCAGAPDHHQEPSSPGTKISLKVPPLGVVAYGDWGHVLQAPARGRPAIVGSSSATSAGTNPPLSPRTEFPPIPSDDLHLPAPLHASARWWRGERGGLYLVPRLLPCRPLQSYQFGL